MEFLRKFKRGGVEYDLYICHVIDRYFVTLSGVETGKMPVTETCEGEFIFRRGREYITIPRQVIESVGSVIYG